MLEGMVKTNLKIYNSKLGSVMHFIKKNDAGFTDFGESYFSTVIFNDIKGWKLHRKMTLNLVVPVGRVLFYFIDARENSRTFENSFKIILSLDPYFRLTVPPGIWFGFKGLSKDLNLICNVASIVHDPNEVIRKDINQINVDWSLK